MRINTPERVSTTPRGSRDGMTHNCMPAAVVGEHSRLFDQEAANAKAATPALTAVGVAKADVELWIGGTAFRLHPRRPPPPLRLPSGGSFSGALRTFSFWIANGTVGHPLLDGIDYSCIHAFSLSPAHSNRCTRFSRTLLRSMKRAR